MQLEEFDLNLIYELFTDFDISMIWVFKTGCSKNYNLFF